MSLKLFDFGLHVFAGSSRYGQDCDVGQHSVPSVQTWPSAGMCSQQHRRGSAVPENPHDWTQGRWSPTTRILNRIIIIKIKLSGNQHAEN